MREAAAAARLLAPLARRYGIQTSYRPAGGGRTVRAGRESLLATLRAAGAPVDGIGDVPGALRERRLREWTTPIEPVLVAPDGLLEEIRVRLPAERGERPVRFRLEPEDGEPPGQEPRTWTAAMRSDRPATVEEVEGRRFVELGMAGPGRIAFGYHRLRVSAGADGATSLVIAAPSRMYPGSGRPSWGVFLPLHALATERSWGVGDLSDLGELLEWTAGLGGSLVATLPLLAAFLGTPFSEPSPYSPASRLMWNELHLDVDAVPEAAHGEAGRLRRSAPFRRELDRLRSAAPVDQEGVMAAKRRVLELAAAEVRPGAGERGRAFRAFLRSNPRVDDYARFRAAGERHGRWWGEWPAAERDGTLPRDGGDREAYRYHRFAQWLMAEQTAALSGRAAAAGAELYVDLPVGANPAGYDVWRERDAFAMDASTGAPPDPFFTGGQDWGFPPPHPDGSRAQGHRYLRECVRHLCRDAGVLRIDHVMGLHRLYWIPRGAGAAEGVYVRSHPEEVYAILALESHRSGTTIVGEDLGTVPPEVRHALDRHELLRSFVMELELGGGPDGAFRDPAPNSLAALNTHDLPTFAAYWRGDDLALRAEHGWLDGPGLAAERARREEHREALIARLRAHGHLPDGPGRPAPRTVLRGCLRALAGSAARMMVVNLEDLWLERSPQNVPGTPSEGRPNWRQRAAHPLEEIRTMPEVVGPLREVDRLRRGPA